MNHQPTRRQQLQVIFAFLVIFGAAMFIVSPDPTHAQTIFRVALMLVGIAALTWMSVRKGGG